MYYSKTKYTELKTIKILTFLLIVLFVGNGTMFAQKKKTNTLEEIGKHLSELLINRGDISESPFAIDIERLFPEKDFTDYEDSPAQFILASLYGAQLILPETWSALLSQADSLNVNKDATYLKTYYDQRTNDCFILTCVLKQSSDYYTFSCVVLGWEDDRYIMRIYKKMKKFNNKKELKKNIFSIVMEERMEELKEIKENFKDLDMDIESFKF